MNLYLKINDNNYDESEIDMSEFNGGIIYRIKYPNNYGASIIKHNSSYGHEDDLWELALIRKEGDNWPLVYTKLVDYDVLGGLTDEQVNEYLEKIKKGEIE